MVLIIHVTSALASIAAASFLYWSPSDYRFKLNYGILAVMFTSGTLLVINSESNLVQSCLLGLTYLLIVALVMVASKRKLARSKVFNGR